MSISKLRGKSAIVQNDSKLMKPYVPATTSLLKIEPFVPTFSTRFRKPIYRSYSTLSSSYFKRVIDQKHRTSRHQERNILQHQRSKSSLSSSKSSQNGVCRVNRATKDQEKLPDRINYDRRGLTAIPVFENEHNLRLLSLQHNLINVFHVPDDSVQKPPSDFEPPPAPPAPPNDVIKPPHANNETESAAQVKSYRNLIASKPCLTVSPSPGIGPGGGAIPGNTNPGTTTSNNSSTGSTIAKNSFVQKSVLLHAHQKYGLKKSKSFMNQYSKHLNTLKQNLQKCSLAKANNLSSFGSDVNSPLADIAMENGGEKNNEDGIQSLKVKNNQLSPMYGSIFENLVFLDLYDNQIEKISNLDGLKSLTVLLLGKNRISEIAGLASLKTTLRVLDLHGNKISSVSNKISCLQELKSLNLAGNQIRQINQNDFVGLLNLKELNLKRNRIKRVYGFNHLSNLERLWLCHNDLHRVEDMSSIAKAINLQEVTIENNPVSLAGDCVSFLVSYLPNLMMLSQMPITDQVRRAAMAWRKNKELSDSNYSNLTSDVSSTIRREEVISNARTNWELLRSQQVLTPNITLSVKQAGTSTTSSPLSRIDCDKGQPQEAERNAKASQNVSKTKTPKIAINKKHRRKSDKNDEEIQDFFRLPPIIQPHASTGSKSPSEKTHSSGSSLGPNIDSSSSSYSSENDDELNEAEPGPESIAIRVPQVNEQPVLECEDVYYDIVPKNDFKEVQVLEERTASPPPPPPPTLSAPIAVINLDTTNISCKDETSSVTIADIESRKPGAVGENSGNDSTNSQSDKNSNLSTTSLKSESEFSSSLGGNTVEKTIRTKGVNRRYMHGSFLRSQTTRSRTTGFSSSNPIPNNTVTNNAANASSSSAKPPKPIVEREREQGGDYLIEICGRYLNIYGLGALRFIDKQWNAQKASDVHTLNFSYINFNSIATILCRIKFRFPNAESFVFRETNINSLGQLNALAELQGITSLVIDPEGNFIYGKNWRLYAIYRLSHWGLKTINGIEITESEIELAQSEYLGLSDLVLWSLPESLLQPLLARLRLEETCTASKLSAKDWLMKADQSLKVVVGKEALQWKKMTAGGTGGGASQDESSLRDRGTLHFTVMIGNTCNAVEKLQLLETLWPNLLLDVVRNTLLDYSQLDAYVKNLMFEIMK